MGLSGWMACAAFVVGMASVIGCGGNVIVDGGGGSGNGSGDGGDGGAPGTTGTSPTSTGNTTFTSPTTSTFTSPPATTGVTTTTSGTMSSTTTSVPSDCDNTGDCGDTGQGCVGCAVAGPCEEVYFGCIDSSECIDFSNCLGDCQGDPGCSDGCAMQYPEGAELYSALVECVICQACPFDCGGFDACP